MSWCQDHQGSLQRSETLSEAESDKLGFYILMEATAVELQPRLVNEAAWLDVNPASQGP